MATTMLPEAPVPEPRTYNPTRTVTIRANLLPDEIVAKRRLRELKRRLLVGLVIILGLLVAWYGLAALQTSSARSDRDSAQRQTIALNQQVEQFGPLVTAQAQSAAIKTELQKLMVGDLPWKDLLATLRAKAPHGVTVTNVSATITSGGSPAGTSTSTTLGGLSVLNASGKQQVGTLTISGTAPDKNAVASYIDALTQVTGLAAPFPASVTGGRTNVTFTVNVLITSDALGGRYATTTSGQGGH